jgi:hypothetical protein
VIAIRCRSAAVRLARADRLIIERRRQIEPGEHAVLETRDSGDPIAGEGENGKAGRVADPVGGAKVGPEFRLTICSRRNELIGAALADESRVQAGSGIAAVILVRNRRHGDADVVREQGRASMSADAYARTNFSTSSCSAGES